jgi:hypothetical protein
MHINMHIQCILNICIFMEYKNNKLYFLLSQFIIICNNVVRKFFNCRLSAGIIMTKLKLSVQISLLITNIQNTFIHK